jgi:hypothetical protein
MPFKGSHEPALQMSGERSAAAEASSMPTRSKMKQESAMVSTSRWRRGTGCMLVSVVGSPSAWMMVIEKLSLA